MKPRRSTAATVMICAVGWALSVQAGSAFGSPVESPTTYSIQITATSGSAGIVDLLGTTNLPNGSRITVVTSRVFLEDAATDTQAAASGGGQAVVRHGQFKARVATDEKDLLIGINTNDPMNPLTISEVSNTLAVCAELATGRNLKGDQNQPDPKVRRAVGADGEHLRSSPNATAFGSLTKHPATYLEVQTSVPFASPLLDRISQLQGKPASSVPLAGFCA
jgi:hypothetical protein